MFGESVLRRSFKAHEELDNERHEENLARFDQVHADLALLKGQMTVVLVVLALIVGLVTAVLASGGHG